jgi:cysteine desulfurase family protein
MIPKSLMKEHDHYLDNASTSFPKPEAVAEAISECLRYFGVSPGRGSHRLGRRSEDVCSDARVRLARLFHRVTPEQLVVTPNATAALNLVLQGLLEVGDHVVTTNLEHNSVLRPLGQLHRDRGVTVSTVFSDALGHFELEDFDRAINPRTKLVVVNHASNVIGVKAPVEDIAALCRDRGVLLLVDASQTLGFEDLRRLDSDFIAFTGHKGLYAPPGIGGVVMKDPLSVRPMIQGGTGGNSHALVQPTGGIDRFEAGTPNYVGLAGLCAALKWLESQTIEKIAAHELALLTATVEGLQRIDGVQLYGSLAPSDKVPLISFNVKATAPQDLAYYLDTEWNIQTRPGLQCAPLIHQTIGTYPHGTVRVSFGYANTAADVEALLEGVRSFIERRNQRKVQRGYVVKGHHAGLA